MSSNNDEENERGKGSFNRRKFLQQAGAAGSGFALSATAAGNAIARDDITIRDRGRGRGRGVAERLSQTDEFSRLKAKAEERGGTVQTGESVNVGEVSVDADETANGEPIHRYVVEYPVEVSETNTEAAIVLAEDATTDSVILSVLDYTHETEDGFTTGIERFDASPTNSGVQAQDSAGGLETSEISIDADATREALNDVDSQGVIGDVYGGFTTGSDLSKLAWDLLDEDKEIDGCYACGFAVGMTCSVGCGATGAFICGLTGIAVPIAGLGCVAFVGIVCDVADALSGCGEAVAEQVCVDQTSWC